MSNFGANFRKAREAAGHSLEKISSETRISTRFLTAIENEAFQLLPGGIFNRGFIKAYAEYLGLDAEQALADYDRMASTAQESLEEVRETEQPSSRSSDWKLYPIAAAILVVLMGAYYLVTRKPSAELDPPPQSPVAAQSSPEAPPPADPPSPAPPTTEIAPAGTAAVSPLPAAQPAPGATRATTPTSPSVPPPPPIAVASALAVNVNVTDSTWIKVTTDGTIALSEVLEAGTARRFSADRSIDVVIGNAAGATMQINGRDLGQLGRSGRVREFRITPENAAQIR